MSTSRSSWLLFGLLAITYVWFFQAATWGATARLNLSRALVERGTLQIDAYHENTGDKAKRGEHYYSDKAPLPSFLGAAGVAAVNATREAFGWPSSRRVALAVSGGLAAWFAGGWLTALAGAVYLRDRRRAGYAPGVAWLSTLFLFLGTLLFPYATVLQGHAPAAAWLFLLFVLLFPGDGAKDVSLRRAGLAGLVAAAALATEYLTGPAIVILALVAAGRAPARAGRLLAGMAGGALPGLALLGWYHHAAFGSPWSLGYQYVALPVYQERMKDGLFGITAPDPAVAGQLLLGPYRGLLFACPVLLAAIAGWGLAVRRDAALRAPALAVALVFAYYWLLNAGYSTWWGGWATGPRHLAPVIPLVGLGLAPALARWPRAVSGVAAVSVLFMLATTSVQPEVPDEIRNPIFDHALPHFVRGELSVGEQGFDDLRPARLDPNEPDRWDAFLLGEAIGLPGLAAVLPLVLLWIAATFVALRRRVGEVRPREAA